MISNVVINTDALSLSSAAKLLMLSRAPFFIFYCTCVGGIDLALLECINMAHFDDGVGFSSDFLPA